MRAFIKILLFMAPIFFAPLSCAQIDIRLELEKQYVSNIQSLRQSLVNLHDLYDAGCRSHGGSDCQIALLANIQIVLLDIEFSYRRISKTSSDTQIAEKADRIKEIASNARHMVDDLADAIKK